MNVVRSCMLFDCRRGWRGPLARVVPVVAVLLGLLAGSQARGDIECIAPDNGGTADLPPICPGGYLSPDEVHVVIDNLDPGTTIILDSSHDRFFNIVRIPGGSLGGEIENFESELQMQMTGTGELGFFSHTATAQVACEVHTGPRIPGDAFQDFDTEMVQLQGAAPDDGTLCGLTVVAGAPSGLPASTGHTTLTQQPDGNWAVDSFFDITYQIDFQGCPGGALAGLTFSGQQTIRMQAGLQTIEPGNDEYMTIDPTSIRFGGDDVPPIPAGLLGNPTALDVLVRLAGNGTGNADTVVRRLDPLPLPTIPSSGTVQTEILSMDLRSIEPIQVGIDSFFDITVRLDPDVANPSTGSMHITRTDANGGVYSCESDVNAIVEFHEVGSTAAPIVMPSFPLHLASAHNVLWSQGPQVPEPMNPPGADAGPNFWPRGIEHEDIGLHMESDGGGVIHNIDPPKPPECYFGEWPNDGTLPFSHVDFGGHFPPIPADFFGPGADPFPPVGAPIARVELRGVELDPARTGGTTTITRQSGDAFRPVDPPSATPATVDIEIVALSLKSIDPITVTFVGGGTELWDMDVSLSQTVVPPPGQMTVQKTHANGGTFDTVFMVQPRFTFTKVGSFPPDVRALDTGNEGTPFIPLEILNAPWVHFVDQTAPGLGGGVYIGPGQTFVPGIEEVTPGDRSSQEPRLVTADEQGPNSNVTHLVCPPPPPPPPPPPDKHKTVQPTQVDFGTATDITPIPADFFEPGSDPFEGIIQLEGGAGVEDTLVQRSGTIVCPDPGGPFPHPCDPVSIEIVALNLRSTGPITVTGTGGDTQWDVRLELSDTPSSLGTLTAKKEHCNGGTFFSTLFVRPVFTFTKVVIPGDPQEVRVLDYLVEGLGEVQLDISGAPWVVTLAPHLQNLDAPNDGDFVPGVAESTPCDPLTQVVQPVTWNSPGGGVGHTIEPPPLVCPLPGDPAIDPCAALQASDCQGSTTDECRPLQVQVDAAGTVSGLACSCITQGTTDCGPMDVVFDPLNGVLTVSCPGDCPAPTGPCFVFVDRNDGQGPSSTGQPSWPSTAFNADDILTCDCETPGEPDEACCDADGTCQNMPPSQCKAVDGTPRGPGTACAGVDANNNGRDDACEFDQPCEDCGNAAGTVSHWIENCLAGQDYMPSGAPVGIDLDLDCIQDQTLVLLGPVAIDRAAGTQTPSPHHIDTEIVSMVLSGGGVTLRAGAGMGQGASLQASLGSIIEQNADPTLGDSSFDVFFELEYAANLYAYNHQPLTVQAKIPCVPPDALYFHPLACIPLYDQPTGVCPDGTTCQTDSDCPAVGDVCNHGTEVARLTKANHDTYPECGTPTADGQACAQFDCPDGSNLPCQPRCAEYDPVSGTTTVTDCDCRETDECHVAFDPATGGSGGLRAGTDNPCVVPEFPPASGTVQLPPEGCSYLSAAEVHAIIGDPPITVTLELDPIHEEIFCGGGAADPGAGCPPPGVCETPGGALGGNTDCFTSNLNLVITGNDPPLAGYSRTINVPVSCLVYTAPRTPGDPVQSFDTEMFRLQGDLPAGDPDFCTFKVTAGREFGLPSPGQTTLTRLPSGDFQVDSFFDIFYQIDFVGCPGSALDGYQGSTTGTIRMATGTAPSCEGGCPAGEICEERKVVNAAGTIEICCDCIPEPTGACCRADGTCAVVPASNCPAPDQYLGDDTVCQGMGACCLDVSNGPAQFETCQMMDGTCCELAGGIFDAGGTCTTVACCLPGGFCADIDPECCAASGGVNSGNGCAMVTCPAEDCQVGPTGWCEQVECPGGTTDQCQPKCVIYDPQTDTTTATLCECIPGDDCYVQASPGTGGLRGGDPCVLPDGPVAGTVLLPPAGCDYLSPEEVHMIVGGLPVPTTIELAAIHKDFVCGPDIQCSVPPPPGLACESDPGNGSLGGNVDCFSSVLDLTVRGNGLLSGFNRQLFVQAEVEVHTGPRNPGDAVQDFDTAMVRLSGGLFGDPDFCTFQMTAGSDFGLPSPGHTTLTQLSGGNWSVDSFFDVEYQIDFVGCPGSVLEGFGGTTTGTLRMETGGMPGCSDTCPAGSRCEESRVFDPATDTFEICCNCVEDVVTPRPARPPLDRRMNRLLAWDPGTGGRALADPIAYRVELKDITLGSCESNGGFCRQEKNECSGSGDPCIVDGDCPGGETCGNSDCGICSGSGSPCINAPIDCPPGQTCNPTGDNCLDDAPDIGGTSVGTVWWVGPECPAGSGQHLLVSEAFRKEATIWASPTLAGDCEIAPQATYGVRAYNVNTASLSAELPIETTLFAPISGSYWADVVGPLKWFCNGDINDQSCDPNQADVDCTGAGTPALCCTGAGTGDCDCSGGDPCELAWTLPEGAVNVDDITAGLWAQSLPPGKTIPTFEWVDLHGNACVQPSSEQFDPPNTIINVSDVQGIIFGFSGRPYTYYDPADCPPRTRCGGVITGIPCTSDGDCTVPDTCQVVCCPL